MTSPATTPGSAPAPAPASMIDWDLAVSIGSRMAGDGPRVAPTVAAAAVEELRADAGRSTGLVRDFTGLSVPDDGTGGPDGGAPVLVVDRPGWIQANADGFRRVMDPLAAKIAGDKTPGGLTRAIGSRVTGAEVGGLLGFLAGKVLGQFDPFSDPAGRLLLVAPNVVAVEQELGVRSADFRLWVCLHEETHRVQFTAVPWMREHLFSEIEALSETVGPGASFDETFKRASEALRQARRGGTGRSGEAQGSEGRGGLLDLLGSPEQKEVLDRVTGMMSLLEGHADVVMDGVGPREIPTVKAIRAKFDQRRQGVGTLDRVLRRLLGLDAKMAQYRDGAAFVRGVVDTVGMERFNAVWERPEHLPSKAELLDHDAWIRRVL